MSKDSETVIKVYRELLENQFDPVAVQTICDCTSFNEDLLNFIEQYRKYGIAAFGNMSFADEACFWFGRNKKTEDELKKIIIYVVTEEVNNEKQQSKISR